METEHPSKEKIILTDNESSAMQFMKSERLRRCKVFCSVQKIIYIAAFIWIAVLIYSLVVPSLLEIVGKSTYDTAAPVLEDQVTTASVLNHPEETLLRENVAQLRGLVSSKKSSKWISAKVLAFQPSLSHLNFSALKATTKHQSKITTQDRNTITEFVRLDKSLKAMNWMISYG